MRRFALYGVCCAVMMFALCGCRMLEWRQVTFYKGLKIRLCRNALNDNNLTEADLWPGIEVVPAGLVEIVRLQQAGFAYIKP